MPIGISLCFASKGEQPRAVADSTLKGEEKRPTYEPGKRFVGTDAAATRVFMRPGAKHIGELQAWNPDTGKKVWTYEYPHINWGPVLTTAGGLVFAGGSSDRMFRAFDAMNGKILWEFRANSGITAIPVSIWSMGCSTSPCRRAGASMRRR